MGTCLLAMSPITGPDEGSLGDSTSTDLSIIKTNEATEAMIVKDVEESGDGGDSDVDADTGFAISNNLVELLQASNLEKRNNACNKTEDNLQTTTNNCTMGEKTEVKSPLPGVLSAGSMPPGYKDDWHIALASAKGEPHFEDIDDPVELNFYNSKAQFTCNGASYGQESVNRRAVCYVM